VGKRKGKKPLGRPWRRCNSKIKMNLKEMERDGMDWVDLAQDMDKCRSVINAVGLI
jgi:hypothetical protein